jgi:S-adenosylmethionine decarboxylase
MAYTDALFQLGMDLTRSSTAQKEDHGLSALAQTENRKDDLSDGDGSKCAGTHLIIDLFGAKRLDDLRHIRDTLRRCVEMAGASPPHIHLHQVSAGGGVSGVAVVAESHITIHSWPDSGYAALDIFMRGEAEAHQAFDVLKAAFAPERAGVREHLRANGISEPAWEAVAAKAKAAKRAPVRAQRTRKAA